MMRSLILVLLVLTGLGSSAQDSPKDSLSAVWSDEQRPLAERYQAMEAFYIKYSNDTPKEVIEISKVHYDLALRNNNGQQLVKALNNRALAYLVQGQVDSSLSSLERCVQIADTLEDKLIQAKLLGNMGNLERELGHLPKAVEYYRGSLAFFSESGDLDIQARLLSNIGLVYHDIKELDLAYLYLDSARGIYEEERSLEENGYLWLIMGTIHHDQGEYDKAMELCQLGIETFESQNNTLSLSDSYQLIAKIHLARSLPDSALVYLNRSLEINRAIGNVNRVGQNQMLLADIHFEDKPELAKELAEEVEATLPLYTSKKVISNAYELLYKNAKREGDANKALEMNEKFMSYKDSIEIEEQRIALIRQAMNESFEVERSQDLLARQEERQTLERQQSSRTTLIVSIGLATIALLVFLMRMRQRSQEKERLELLAELEELRTAKSSTQEDGITPAIVFSEGFQLDRVKIRRSIEKDLNETDWKVLELLAKDPVMSNRELAERSYRSIDGIGSSLRRMYVLFSVKESKYKKISLILKAIKLSGSN